MSLARVLLCLLPQLGLRLLLLRAVRRAWQRHRPQYHLLLRPLPLLRLQLPLLHVLARLGSAPDSPLPDTLRVSIRDVFVWLAVCWL